MVGGLAGLYTVAGALTDVLSCWFAVGLLLIVYDGVYLLFDNKHVAFFNTIARALFAAVDVKI
jgi:hypothetical protein